MELAVFCIATFSAKGRREASSRRSCSTRSRSASVRVSNCRLVASLSAITVSLGSPGKAELIHRAGQRAVEVIGRIHPTLQCAPTRARDRLVGTELDVG